ncbi:Crp/Fnr family transcriptional regulator [Pedobacter aquatilis]|uniref:Crp/Fnr family transcriptional regulator n=1 Tax=Pedobacter aquatilis TaxID=351343 RepID=UPI00292D62DF|nr:Crp/Fnr family transcriptional regulator [Pedobacter aquatilis]
MDALQILIDQISPHQQISTDLRDYLTTSIRQNNYPKNHHLIKIGQQQQNIHFLLSGTARVYVIDPETQSQNTIWFWHPQQIIIPFEGLASKKKSQTAIILTEKATLLSLPLIHLKYMSQRFPEFINIAQMVLETLIKNLSDHMQMMKKLNTHQRYELLMQQHGNIFNTVTLREVASYLGMSLNTLNHLRSIK